MGTQAGMILGTASYMSPEQARGLGGDHRSDVFSFGVVLFEMLTGRQPFQGDTVSDVLASVLAREPDLAHLPSDAAPRLTELVKRCLEKHPKRRWQAIGDVRHELEVIGLNPRRVTDPASELSMARDAAPPRPRWRRAVPVAAAALIGVAATAAAFLAMRPAVVSQPVSRFVVLYPEGQQRTSLTRVALAISPDGTRIAYVADREIYVRALADPVPRLISRGASATTSPLSLAFSPDSESLAFFDQFDQKIKRLDLAGGAPVAICAATNTNGITWSRDYLYFSAQGSLRRVLAAGGEPEIIAENNPDVYQTTPQVLADGRLLYSIAEPGEGDRWLRGKIVLQRPGEATRTTLVEGGSDPRVLATGHLVYQSNGVLFARTFDPRTGALGAAASVVNGVLRPPGLGLGAGMAWYSVSSTGTLVYMPGAVGTVDPEFQLSWFDRAGKAEPLALPPGPYLHPRVSADGKRIAFMRADQREMSVWVHDLGTGGSPRRVTFGGSDRNPVWSADSQRIIFQRGRDGEEGLFWQPADGSGVAERLTTAAKGEEHTPTGVQPDGSVLLFDKTAAGVTTVMVHEFKSGKATAFGGVSSQTRTAAVFSPDGRWVAYSQRDQGRALSVVYVQPYPATGAKHQISTSSEDGHHQVWSPDGRELVYTPGPGTAMAAVRVTTLASTLSMAPADPVGRLFLTGPPSNDRHFDMGRTGFRILGITPGTAGASAPVRPEIHVVLNWFDELKARVR